MKIKNKELIKKLYEEYKIIYLNEIYDTPLQFKKESNTEYIVCKENGDELAYFYFKLEYEIDKSSIDFRRYKINNYWEVNWLQGIFISN